MVNGSGVTTTSGVAEAVVGNCSSGWAVAAIRFGLITIALVIFFVEAPATAAPDPVPPNVVGTVMTDDMEEVEDGRE